MGQIISVHGREILDSRGNPTIEVARTKRSSCVTATRAVTAERAC